MKTPFWTLVLATLLVPLLVSPAAASEAGGPAVFGSYWHAFVEYWKGFIQQQNGIVMAVLGLGVVALFIITRGKWRK